VLSAKVPTEQLVQAERPSPELYDPGKQAMQFDGLDAPVLGPFVPARHFVHTPALDPPAPVLKVPRGHATHMLLPSPALYDPREHVTQLDWLVAPVLGPYVPAGQLVHIAEPAAVL